LSSDIQTWSSNGKLLITGEYLVMEGAFAMALPLKKGQSLSICKNDANILRWQANTLDGIWFTADYDLNTLDIIVTDNTVLAQKLQDILIATRGLSHTFLTDNMGFNVETDLDFNPEFGFGTSSTLISNIAIWADVDPYKLLGKTFGGSGYDIACARNVNPLFFQLVDSNPIITDVNFSPLFKDNLYFVYLGKKQSSVDGIEAFRKNASFTSSDIDAISEISMKLIKSETLSDFDKLLTEHELIMSRVLKMPTVKSLYFSDFPGAVKSLGAWGGDFVLMASDLPEIELKHYLHKKGFDTVFRYDELVLNGKGARAQNFLCT